MNTKEFLNKRKEDAWFEHPVYTYAVWRGEVAEQSTQRGYEDFVLAKLEE